MGCYTDLGKEILTKKSSGVTHLVSKGVCSFSKRGRTPSKGCNVVREVMVKHIESMERKKAISKNSRIRCERSEGR